MSSPGRGKRRHYKVDSRFVGDLYTLTYDDHGDDGGEDVSEARKTYQAPV